MRALILVAAAGCLAACTTAQKTQVESTTAAICASVPLAQSAYNTAVQSHNENTVNFVLTTLTAFCPTILAGIQLVPIKTESVPVVPAPGPERG